jgi:lipid kinase YegS
MSRSATPRRIALIIHGARAGHEGLRRMVDWVRDRGHVVDPRVTWESGDAERFAREAAGARADVVVAVGGDGTLNEVVNGLAGSTVPLGIIPLGTANDFARQVGIPDDPDHAMDVILRRNPVCIDSAELNGRRFLNVSTAGVPAEATAETPQDLKAQLGVLAYALTGVRKFVGMRRYTARVTGPGLDLDCRFLVAAVGNARTTGGGSRVTPRALVTDGLLDVCIVEAMPRRDFARILLKLRRGEHVGAEGVHYFKLPSLTITARRPVSVNVDGEPMRSRVLHYVARPRDLWVHLPHLPEEKGADARDRDDRK